MASQSPYKQQKNVHGVGSFADWVEKRAEEAVAQPAPPVRTAKARVSEKGAPKHRVLRDHRDVRFHSERSHTAQQNRQKPEPAAKTRLAPATEHRMARLRPVAAGHDLRVMRRRARLERAILVVSVVAVMFGALVSVVTRAEIAKLQLQSDSLQPALAKLTTSNAELTVTYGQLSAPARIAAIAQTQLHMVFPAGSQVALAAGPGSTSSATGQPLSLYYSPSGESVAPATTVTTAVAKEASSAPASAAKTTPSGAASTTTTVVTPASTTSTTTPVLTILPSSGSVG